MEIISLNISAAGYAFTELSNKELQESVSEIAKIFVSNVQGWTQFWEGRETKAVPHYLWVGHVLNFLAWNVVDSLLKQKQWRLSFMWKARAILVSRL